MRRWTSRILLPALLALAVISSGCGGGGSSSSSGSGSVTVTISPVSTTVTLSATQQFSASVSGAKTIAIAGTSGAVRASNVVTITTTAAHGFAVGQTVTVSGVTDASFSGTFTIVSVPSTTTFTYSQTAGDATSGGGNIANVSVTWFVNDVQGGNATVGTITTGGLFTAGDALPPSLTATITASGAVRNSNTVTITTTAAHNFVVGQIVIISGVTDTSFNGTFFVNTVPSTTTFTYQQLANNASSGGGTVTSFAVKIKAVSVADATASATAVVDVSSGITVRVTPSTAVVGTSETIQFFATVIGSSNSAVTWAVNDISGGNPTVGTISTNGLFLAPASPPTSSTAAIITNGATRAFNGAVRSSNVVTITTVAAHAFAISQSVTISGASDSTFNGTFSITSVPTTTSFTYAQTGSNASSSGGTATSGSNSATIATTSVVTIVTSTAHGFIVGQSVTIAGVSDTSFNGTFTIASVPAAATFTYAQNGPNATSGGGTATSLSPSVSIKATSVADTTRSVSVLVRVQIANNPTLTSINPTRAPQGAVFQDVFLTGTDFLSTSVVRINGAPLAFTAISQFSSTLIRARIPASLLASTGTLVIDVLRQSGATSTSQNLTVLAGRPALVGASPDSGVQGGGTVSFNVNGGYFGAVANPSITAEFGGNTRSATVDPNLEARRASVTIGGADLSTAGMFSVAVRNASNPALYAATNLAVRPSGAPAVLGAPIAVGSMPSAIAINSATGVAVVTNRCSNSVTRIDVNTLATIGSNIIVGTYPTGVAVDDVRNIAVVANNGNNTGCPGPAGTPSLSIVDLTAGTVTATITTGLSGAPFSVGINPLTGLALVTYQSTNHADILDLTQVPPAFVSTTTIGTGANPQVAVDSQLNWAVVTPGGAGTLSIVDLSRRVTSAIAATSGASRTNSVTTITTSTSHAFRQGEVVRISGVADATFNGTFTISAVPSSTSFTYVQTGAPNGTSSGGSVVTTEPVAIATIGQNVRGIGINAFTQQALLADPSVTGPLLFNLFDQAVTSIPLNENGATAAAFNRFTNIAVTTNALTNEASVIDPQIPTRLAKVTVGNGPRAVAIDAGTNTALVVNETDGTVTAIGLGAIRPLHISTISLPLTRQFAPGVTLSSAVDLPVTILGKGFVVGSQVRLDGVPLAPPAGVSDRQLTVLVPAALLAGPKNFVVDVLNPGGVLSNVLQLTVVQAVDLVGAGGASCTAPAPAAVAIDPERDIAVVANSGCNSASFIDLTTGTISSTVPVQTAPRGVAVSSRLGKAVVTNSGSASASILDLTTVPPTVTSSFTVGSEPLGAAIDEGKASAIVANASSNTISIVDLTAGGGGSNTMSVDARPVAVAVDPDREVAVVAHAASNSLAVVNLSSLTISGRLPSIFLPTGVVFDPSTGLFMANSSLGNTVVLMDPNTLQSLQLRTGINPTSLALNFNSSTLVTVNAGSKSISVMDYVDRRIRAVLGIAASSQSAVAIHPRTNLAVILDETNNRVLLVPLPR